jgi:hypothetical protein
MSFIASKVEERVKDENVLEAEKNSLQGQMRK